MSRCVPCSRASHRDPSSPCRPAARADPRARDGQGGNEDGEGVPADQLHHDAAGPGGADPAQQDPEPVRQILGPVREVRRALAGDEPDGHPVGVAGRGHPAENGQQDPALVERGKAADGHDGGPVPLVVPPPPFPQRGPGDEPGKRPRVTPPPYQQDSEDRGGESADAGPSQEMPGEERGGRCEVQQGVADGEGDQSGEQPPGLHDGDHPAGCVEHRGPPDRRGERVGVADLGDLVAGERRHLHDATPGLPMPGPARSAAA